MDCISFYVDNKLLKLIKNQTIFHDFSECGKCGAFIVNAMELAALLNKLNESLDEEENFYNEIESCLFELIEPDPYVLEPGPNNDKNWGINWTKWINENEYRKCKFKRNDDYEDYYIKYEDAILYSNLTCSCFGEYKTKQPS